MFRRLLTALRVNECHICERHNVWSLVQRCISLSDCNNINILSSCSMWISKVGKLHELVFGEKSASLAIEAAADFVFIETDTSRNGTVEMQTQFRPRQSHKPADTQSPLLIWFRRTDIVVCMCCLSGCFPIFLVWTWHSDFLEFGSKPKPLSDRLQEVKQAASVIYRTEDVNRPKYFIGSYTQII